ncbi:MAG: PorV/PorQ family protein [Chitinophagales bacterium]|nr:PorV/PorQ family protein [Bacteroidota bacterium]MBP7400513.1 PorV/PorQ family protein [Chitinophagales bacterium]MBK8682112.1 PorV/PorQ family protein [Bacteroidota bacterium]MBP8755209.1 PorV/PorQ family protein [Chitinophagales bacterium]MBP9189591.1 PorV/PorQ family protein [Chitinophagales bacterium]
MKYLLLICISLLFFVKISEAQTARKYSNEFLSIGVSAEALGMGGSVVAGVDDVTAGYWNPAGLVLVTSDYEVGIMHSEYFAGIAKYDYAGIAIPLKEKNSALAFSIIRFGVDDIPNTLFLIGPDGSINYDNITSFSVADYGFLGSYATKLDWNDLRIGFNAKVVHRTAGYFATAWGFGLDAGAQMDKNNWQFGIMLRDITSTFNAWSFAFTDADEQVLVATGNALPENSLEITTPKIILGTGYNFDIGENFGGKSEINLDVTTDGKRNVLVSAAPFSMDPHLGIEFNYKEFIYLRGGVNNLQQAIADDATEESWIIQPNIGVGLVIGPVKLDYAYTNIGNQGEILYSHVISLALDFNKKVAPLKNQ